MIMTWTNKKMQKGKKGTVSNYTLSHFIFLPQTVSRCYYHYLHSASEWCRPGKLSNLPSGYTATDHGCVSQAQRCLPQSACPLLTACGSYLLCRWDGGAGDAVAHRDLPPREERGDEQSAGHRQHGRRVLHAGGRHGAQPHHLHLGAPLLLEAALLFHGHLLWPAGAALLHQQGQYPWRPLPFAVAGPGKHRASRESGGLDFLEERVWILSVYKLWFANPDDYSSQKRRVNGWSRLGMRKAAPMMWKIASEIGCLGEGTMEDPRTCDKLCIMLTMPEGGSPPQWRMGMQSEYYQVLFVKEKIAVWFCVKPFYFKY